MNKYLQRAIVVLTILVLTTFVFTNKSFAAGPFDDSYPFKEKEEVSFVKVIGIDDTGLFFVYDLTGFGLNDWVYYSGSTKFETENLLEYMMVLTRSDKATPGITCGKICVNSSGEIIGIDPDYADSINYRDID